MLMLNKHCPVLLVPIEGPMEPWSWVTNVQLKHFEGVKWSIGFNHVPALPTNICELSRANPPKTRFGVMIGGMNLGFLLTANRGAKLRPVFLAPGETSPY